MNRRREKVMKIREWGKGIGHKERKRENENKWEEG